MRIRKGIIKGEVEIKYVYIWTFKMRLQNWKNKIEEPTRNIKREMKLIQLRLKQ